MTKQEKKGTEEERFKVWEQIFASEFKVEKYNGNTYIGYLGMYLKLSKGKCFMMSRETGKWDEVDGLTLRPIKIKGEHMLREYRDGYEPNAT